MPLRGRLLSADFATGILEIKAPFCEVTSGSVLVVLPDAPVYEAAPALADALEAMLASQKEMTAPFSATNPLTFLGRQAMERREKEATDAARAALRLAGRLP